MLLQVWVRGRRKNTRAHACRAGPGSGSGSGFGRRARARDVRVNGPPKSESNSCGKSAFFCRFVFCYIRKEPIHKEPIVPHDRLSGKEPICSPVLGKGRATSAWKVPKSAESLLISGGVLFCHFESVTDITRGILGTRNRLGFWDAKNPSGFPYKYVRMAVQKCTT
jgi:hypothetical protein